MKQFTPLTAVTVLALTLLVVALVDVSSGQSTSTTRAPGRRRNRGRGASRDRTANRRNRGNRRRGGRGGSGGRGGRRNRGPPAECEEIYLPMCKGLIPYTHTKLPNAFNHTTQLEVHRHLEHLQAYMDHSCSRNTRLLACSTYLPKCHRRGPPMGPCKRTCMAAKRKCGQPLQQMMGLTWAEKFPCRGLPAKKCLKPMKDKACPEPYPNPSCPANSPINVCANISIAYGTLPNMFEQCHTEDINKETDQFSSLIATGCHQSLPFLLCGVYSPFCIRGEIPYTFPCRELCEEIRTECEASYRSLNHNLPWPNKLQCHRYPWSTDDRYQCVMPDENDGMVEEV